MSRTIGVFLFVGAVFFAGGLLYPEGRPPPVEQPIAFNHKLHAEKGVSCSHCHFRCEKNRDEDGDLDCDACDESEFIFCERHVTCPDHKLPGLPGVAVCAGCHDGDDPDTPAKATLLRHIEAGEPIPWQTVTRIDGSNVHFSHRTHAMLGKILCSECHGEMETAESPPTRPAVEVDMDWCIDCHHSLDASEGCVACHR